MPNDQMLTPVQNGHTNPTIEFCEGQILFRMTTLQGAKIEKLVSWESAREAFTKVPFDSGWLPPEVRRTGQQRGIDWTVGFIPPQHHRLEITKGLPGENETVEHILAPLPGMVIFGIAVKYWVFAVKTEELDPYQEIFRAPLANVMADAEVCWGLLKPPRSSPRTIMQAWRTFIESTFNNHAASGKSRMNRDDVRETLRELAAQGPEARYPTEDLVRQTEEGVSLDKAVRIFLETQQMPGI